MDSFVPFSANILSVFKMGPVAFEMGGGIIKDPVNVEKLMQLHVLLITIKSKFNQFVPISYFAYCIILFSALLIYSLNSQIILCFV